MSETHRRAMVGEILKTSEVQKGSSLYKVGDICLRTGLKIGFIVGMVVGLTVGLLIGALTL